MSDKLWEKQNEKKEYYGSFTNKQLQKYCKKRGAKVGGKKQDLIERLLLNIYQILVKNKFIIKLKIINYLPRIIVKGILVK